MRLPTEFIRLPLRFDAARLAEEVAAIEASAWRQHPRGFAGGWVLPLLAADGDPARADAMGPMRPTPELARSPYLRQVLATLAAPIGRAGLFALDGRGEVPAHADGDYYWLDRLRVHVPIATTPGVECASGERRVHMAAGEAWLFDTWRVHAVTNPDPTRRIHLVADTVGSGELATMLESGAWPFVEPPRLGAPARFVPFRPGVETALSTEERGQPPVMTPWELAAHGQRWLADVAEANRADRRDHTLADLERELAALAQSWRALWSRYGESAAGHADYRTALAATAVRLAALGHGLRMTNGLDAIATLHDWILRVALAPAVTPATGAAGDTPFAAAEPTAVARVGAAPSRLADASPRSATGAARAHLAAPRRFARPIFIVCPPRSGSSLLFETLAQSPDLWTIGGESHSQFERLPALRPERRGWSSNRLTAEDAHPALVERLVDSFFLPLRDRDRQRPAAGAENLRLLEKTPKNALRVPFLAAAFPDALFVYLYRNPRETINSILEAWQSGRFVTYPQLPGWIGPPWSLALVPGWRELAGRPLPEIAARQWQSITEHLLEDLGRLAPERWCVANYGALVSRPLSEIERLCGYLGVGWDRPLAAPLPASRHTLTPPEAGKWRRNAAVLAQVLPLVAPTAERALDLFAHRPGHAALDLAALEEDEPIPAEPAAAPAATSPAPTAASVSATPPPSASPATSPAIPPSAPVQRAAGAALRSVHTRSLAEILHAIGGSLVVTTYQSGCVVVVRADGSQVNTHFSAYPSPMGLAVGPRYVALGTKHHVWELRNVPAAAPRVVPAGPHDACFLPRRQHFTGDLRVHELAFAGEELWFVATRFSCLATLDADHSFVPRWRPPFISALAPEDRCHLNGLCVVDGRPRYATALGATDAKEGWRENKAAGGILLDVPSGETIVSGLSMPHSPRFHRGRLWLLESGKGELNVVDPASGRVETVASLPGFTRGLAFAGPFAFVGLSQVRESVFGGLPLSQRLKERRCGVWAVDLRTGAVAGFLRFEDAVQEIFDVQVFAGLRFPHFSDPSGELLETTYVVPSRELGAVRGVPVG